jgi:cystathionine beta-lyase/cystathionine gamma-synthase
VYPQYSRGTQREIPGGGKFVIPTASYLGTGALIAELEKKGRVKPIWVDITKTDEVIAALDGAQMLYFESPTNLHRCHCHNQKWQNREWWWLEMK